MPLHRWTYCSWCRRRMSPKETSVTPCGQAVHNLCRESHIGSCTDCNPPPVDRNVPEDEQGKTGGTERTGEDRGAHRDGLIQCENCGPVREEQSQRNSCGVDHSSSTWEGIESGKEERGAEEHEQGEQIKTEKPPPILLHERS